MSFILQIVSIPSIIAGYVFTCNNLNDIKKQTRIVLSVGLFILICGGTSNVLNDSELFAKASVGSISAMILLILGNIISISLVTLSITKRVRGDYVAPREEINLARTLILTLIGILLGLIFQIISWEIFEINLYKASIVLGSLKVLIIYAISGVCLLIGLIYKKTTKEAIIASIGIMTILSLASITGFEEGPLSELSLQERMTFSFYGGFTQCIAILFIPTIYWESGNRKEILECPDFDE